MDGIDPDGLRHRQQHGGKHQDCRTGIHDHAHKQQQYVDQQQDNHLGGDGTEHRLADDGGYIHQRDYTGKGHGRG